MAALRSTDLATLKRIFKEFPRVREVRLYGSRAHGHPRRASDIDLAISGPDMTPSEWADLSESLETAPIIYELDVVRFDFLPAGPLRRKIISDGIRLI